MPSRPKFTWTGILATTFAILSVPTTAHTQSGTVVERMLARENPCRALRVNMLGMNVALDRLDAVEVTSVEMSIQRDSMIVELLGRLSCSTGSNSMARGDIQASVRLFASMDLATCTDPVASVSLSNIAGSFGEVVQGFQPELEAAMTSELSRQLVAECRTATTLP